MTAKYVGTQTIRAESVDPALRITQSGTGNALVVEDAATDTTPFVIDASGNVGIGTATPTASLDVAGILKTTAGNIDQAMSYGAEGSVLDNLPVRIHPTEQLLKQAVWWIDSSHSSAGTQSITNLGSGGSALNARSGSTTSADTNDPKYLSWEGDNYVYLPGVANNYMSVPDANNLDITGDIDIRVQVAMDDWTPATQGHLISKFGIDGVTQWSWRFAIQASGFPIWTWSTGGTTATVVNKSSTAIVPFIDGNAGWVRVTHTVNNGASGNDVRFYTSIDGITWTQLGTTVTTAGVTSIYSGTSPIEVGSIFSGGASELGIGKFYRAQILNGINGTPVLDVDTSLLTSGSATTFPALTGQTVTINRSTSGRKSVAVVHPCWLFGTDDYMEVPAKWIDGAVKNVYLPGIAGNYMSTPDAAALDITGNIDIRVKVAMDDWTPSSVQYLVSKYGVASNTSYVLGANGGSFFLQWTTDGTTVLGATSTVTNTFADGSIKWVRATMTVNNGAAGRDINFFTSDDNVTWTQFGATVTQAGTTSIFSGTSPLYIGTLAPSSGQMAGNVYNVQIYNGIAGTKVLDVDTSVVTDVAQTTLTAVTGQTVTLVKTGTSYVTTPMVASGYIYPTGTPNNTPSTYSIFDFSNTDSFTVIAVTRRWSSIVNYGPIIQKRDDSFYGWLLANDTGTSRDIFSTSIAPSIFNTVVSPSFSYGTTTVSTGVRIGATRQITSYINAVAGSSAIEAAGWTSIGNSKNIFINFNNDTEFIAAAVFRRALTATEIAQVNSYFQGRAA